MSHAVKPSRRSLPRHIMTPAGRIIPRDTSEHVAWLAVHRRTKGGAFIVSRTGREADAIPVPCALLDLGPPSAGFESMDHNCQRVLVPIHWASGPGFIFDEKGLR